jgi:hypothetical protein
MEEGLVDNNLMFITYHQSTKAAHSANVHRQRIPGYTRERIMRHTLRTLFLLSWAFWFGGLMFLFFAVSALFAQGHAIGTAAAPAVFLCFEKYHLILACISLIACAPLTRTPPQRIWRLICVCIAFGCITSLVTSQWLTPRINALHLTGLVNTPEFRRLHGISFAVYLCEATALLVVGLILPSTENM